MFVKKECDAKQDKDMLELVELERCELLVKYMFESTKMHINRGLGNIKSVYGIIRTCTVLLGSNRVVHLLANHWGCVELTRLK